MCVTKALHIAKERFQSATEQKKITAREASNKNKGLIKIVPYFGIIYLPVTIKTKVMLSL
jgi:hypothetical protein